MSKPSPTRIFFQRALLFAFVLTNWFTAIGQDAGHASKEKLDDRASVKLKLGNSHRVAVDRNAVQAYNEGIRAYRDASFDDAMAAFQTAAASPDNDLAAQARYNLGNTFYAKAVDQLSKPPADAETKASQTGPQELLMQAVEAYRNCLRLTPDDHDARFNLENASRLIDAIKQQKDDQQDQQQDKDKRSSEDDSESESKEENDSQQSDDKKSSEEGKEDDAQENDPGPSDPGPSDPEQKDPEQKDPEQKDPEQKDPGQKDPGQEDSGQDQEPSESQSANETKGDLTSENEDQHQDEESPQGQAAREIDGDQQPLPDEMTAQEARKMLQAIRDREMLRRLRLEAARRSRRVAVPRDW